MVQRVEFRRMADFVEYPRIDVVHERYETAEEEHPHVYTPVDPELVDAVWDSRVGEWIEAAPPPHVVPPPEGEVAPVTPVRGATGGARGLNPPP
jgi:hypothetical protein